MIETVVGSALGCGLAWLSLIAVKATLRTALPSSPATQCQRRRCLHRLEGVGTCQGSAGHAGLHSDCAATWSDAGYYWHGRKYSWCEPSLVCCNVLKPCSKHRVAVPLDPVEVAANRLSDVGFVAMSVRLRDDAVEAGKCAEVGAIVEAAATRLCSDLQWCRECRELGGKHGVECREVADMVDMAAPEMMCTHKENKEYE